MKIDELSDDNDLYIALEIISHYTPDALTIIKPDSMTFFATEDRKGFISKVHLKIETEIESEIKVGLPVKKIFDALSSVGMNNEITINFNQQIEIIVQNNKKTIRMKFPYIHMEDAFSSRFQNFVDGYNDKPIAEITREILHEIETSSKIAGNVVTLRLSGGGFLSITNQTEIYSYNQREQVTLTKMFGDATYEASFTCDILTRCLMPLEYDNCQIYFEDNMPMICKWNIDNLQVTNLIAPIIPEALNN